MQKLVMHLTLKHSVGCVPKNNGASVLFMDEKSPSSGYKEHAQAFMLVSSLAPLVCCWHPELVIAPAPAFSETAPASVQHLQQAQASHAVREAGLQ